MKPTHSDENSQPLSATQRSIGGAVPSLRVMLENGMGNGGRRWRVTAGFLLQAALLATLLVLPLLFTESLDSSARTPQIVIVIPPEGVPEGTPTGTGGGGATGPAPPHTTVSPLSDKPVLTNPWNEATVGPEIPGIGIGEEPGSPRLGIPGGREDGGLWPWMTDGQPPQPTEPIRVGGRVRAPRLLRMVKPNYPFVARQARIEGDVRLEAVLGTDGRVQSVQVVEGHPALREAAVEAVKQWVYEPTYLNDRPVPVILEVVCRFRLRN